MHKWNGQRLRIRMRSRRRVATLTSALALLLFALPASSAFAVHDTGLFELDGNATHEASVLGDDWDQVCRQATNGAVCNAAGSNTTGATAVAWTAELDTSASIFTGGGSKDPIDLSSWAWKDAGGLPDKDNLLHSFAARYVVDPDADDPNDPNDTICPSGTATKCDVLYFGSDRFDNSGDAQQGFWFFQNKVTLGNIKSGGGFNFNGVHRTGDLLVISDFSNGGTVSTISVYKWNPAVDGNLELLLTDDSAKCPFVSPGDAACGLVNEGAALVTSPWPFLDKSGNTGFAQGEFYEGGVNLSLLGLANECFNSALSESRSSTSTTATLKDFVLGQFGNCTATIRTDASNKGTVLPGTPITDTATIVGSNPLQPPTGDVDFFLCGPLAAGAEACPTGGANAGTDKPLSSVGQPAGTSVATSDQVNTAASPLAPGRYCFRAFWPGDTNYIQVGGFSHTDNVDECFTVQDTSSITTAQQWLPQDTAAVTTAGGSAVSGKVVFSLYENGTCSGTAATTFEDSSAPFETNNSTYRTTSTTISWSATFTPDNGVAGSTTTSCERSDLTINNSASPFPPAP